MVKTKKMLAVVMALVMLLSCSAVVAAASEYTYSPSLTTGEVAFIAEADKTTVNPGDTVTITLKINSGSKTDLGAFNNLILYNSKQLQPISTTASEFRTWLGDCSASFVNPDAKVNYAYATSKLTALTAYEKTYFDKSALIMGTALSSANRWNPAAGEAYVSFKMVVSASVTPGEEIWVGLHDAGFKQGVSSLAEGTTRLAATAFNLTNSMVKLTVAAAGPAVAKSKAEVKMTANAEKTAVEEAFSFRVTSVITKADWDTYFANSADPSATTKAIQAVGFVAYKGTTGFNLDTAKAVAQGTPAAGYDVKTTNYIQKVNDASDAYFGCRLEITSAATRSDVTYVAFVQYLDDLGNPAYAFYDAGLTALLDSNYGDIVNTYLNAIKGA